MTGDAPLSEPAGDAMAFGPGVSGVDVERKHLKRPWPDEFADGERCAFLGRFEGAREGGGYPLGFHAWPLERRNRWYCGFNYGLLERRRALMEVADG
jgi:hypothetical protein